MEPWKRWVPTSYIDTYGCFNGATAMEPWKRKTLRRSRAEPSLLQWGHGDGAVEEGVYAAIASQVINGFNGATAMEPWKSQNWRSS